MTFVLAHGWGFDPSFWNPLRSALEEAEVIAVSFGFRGARFLPPLPADRPLIGVGHSLGFAWLLQQPVEWAGLVAINGFARFTRSEDFPQGVPPHRLERMRSELRTRLSEVLSDFLRRCGVAQPDPAGHQPERLAEGLEWLAEWDGRAALAAYSGPLLALAGEADPIVPAAMTRATFPQATLRWRPDGGHLLPSIDPEWSAVHIRALARELA